MIPAYVLLNAAILEGVLRSGIVSKYNDARELCRAQRVTRVPVVPPVVVVVEVVGSGYRQRLSSRTQGSIPGRALF